ncbi:hypothetical protein PoB_006322500 [Plakobranchus ocellatus]|uniref:Uncharacterized protein n=1 Tax=Plakobranchus ocellatus TaxID=259542 RepID=A0AAV4CY58_9GAST|nr:hypothetical protein PoB_006322500 [Plakobranchus ocellatus]
MTGLMMCWNLNDLMNRCLCRHRPYHCRRHQRGHCRRHRHQSNGTWPPDVSRDDRVLVRVCGESGSGVECVESGPRQVEWLHLQ